MCNVYTNTHPINVLRQKVLFREFHVMSFVSSSARGVCPSIIVSECLCPSVDVSVCISVPLSVVSSSFRVNLRSRGGVGWRDPDVAAVDSTDVAGRELTDGCVAGDDETAAAEASPGGCPAHGARVDCIWMGFVG